MRINGPRRGMRVVPALAGWSRVVPALAVWPLVAPVAAAAAQTPSARVRLEPPEVTVGEMLRLVLEIRGVREIEQVVRPEVRGFSAPGLPLETTVGVRVGEAGAEVAENSFTLSYQLVARSVGSHDVGPFRITADGRTIETEAVTVRVVPREEVGVTVVARVEPPRVRVGESFRLRAEIRGSSLTEHEFVLPDVFDFADSGGGSLGSHERSWSLRAEVPGVFVVPPVRVSNPGGTYESESMTVVIEPAPIDVQATVEAGSIWVGGEFTLRLEVTGAGELDREPTLPETDAFAELVALVDSSSSRPGMSAVPSLEREYRYRALGAGRFVIGPARVAVAGRTLATGPIAIVVDEAPTLEEDPPAGMFMVGSPSKTRAYVNEPVIVAYALGYDAMATTLGSPLPGTASWPSFDGFEVLELRQGWSPELVVDGRPLESRVLRRVALVPRVPGRLRVDGAVAEARLNRFGGPGSATGGLGMTSIVLASEPFTLEVLPLPEEGRPASFMGFVGRLSIASWVDRTRMEVGDTSTLEVEVSVEGHVETLPDPEIDFPDGLAVSAPEIGTTFRDRRGELSGSRTYVYRVTAAAPGSYRIPAVEVSFFDAESESYGTARGQPLTITVVPRGSGGR